VSDAGADAPVLVVLVNNRTDWAHVVERGWYRIPLKHMPNPVAASYLAFYQSRVFGADAFRVRFYAPVLRYRLATRRELLPDQPDHPRADEQYYRVEVGPLVELAYPVPSRRLRRITFIPTTLRRLEEADEINDLWLGDDVEEMLWSLFRDAGLKAERRLEIGEGKHRYVGRRRWGRRRLLRRADPSCDARRLARARRPALGDTRRARCVCRACQDGVKAEHPRVKITTRVPQASKRARRRLLSLTPKPEQCHYAKTMPCRMA
jgi:hypothetical protein